MQVKLHNKYEIICGNITYVANNTMLKTVFTKLKNLEPYNSYFALGSGTTDVAFSDSSLDNYVASYPSVTQQVQPNILAGDMFVVKSKVFEDNEAEGLSFSEIGITDCADTNPIVYNRVVFKDSNGNPITITKPSGQRLIIKLTIYLELDSMSKMKLVAGDNILVKQLLGENTVVNKNFVIVKSNDTSLNVPIYREAPENYTTIQYDKFQYNLKDDSGFHTELTCDFGQGEIIEILLMLDNKPVLRYNCQNQGIDFGNNKNVEAKITMRINGFNE